MRFFLERQYNGFLIRLKEPDPRNDCGWFWEVWKDGEKKSDNSKQQGEETEKDAMLRAQWVIDYLLDDGTDCHEIS